MEISVMNIIVGLGNPGKQYEHTRHNAGFIIIDGLAKKMNADPFHFEKKFNAEVAGVVRENTTLLLVKPQTYMNNAGRAVRALMDYYKLLPKTIGVLHKKNADLSGQLIVVHDDIDFELGTFKIQKNRSAGGHNGVNSVIEHLKTQNFTRVRVGVATPRKNRLPTDKFVLENFSQNERDVLKKQLPHIVNSILIKAT